MGTYSGVAYHIAPRTLNQGREFSPVVLFADSVRHIINGHVSADDYYKISTSNNAMKMKESTLEQRMVELFAIDLNPLIAMTRKLNSELSFFKAWNTWQKYTQLAVSTVVKGGSNNAPVIERAKTTYEEDPPAARDAALCAFNILTNAARVRRLEGAVASRQPEKLLSNIASILGVRDTAIKEAVLCLEEMGGLNVGRLSRYLGCHRKTLERHFKVAGLAPNDLKMACALNGATNNLWGTKSLTDIAHENGFSDHAHMTRAFRKACSLPPSILRSLAAPIGIPLTCPRKPDPEVVR